MLYILSLLVCFAMEDKMYNLLEKSQSAAFGTMYGDVPFTSLVPYVLDGKGRPILYISELAIHTKNIHKNPICSLMVGKEDKDDVFNSQRITFIGKIEKIPEKDMAEAKKAYLKKYPTAEILMEMELEDFSLYRIKITKIYYVGGFGDISWIALDDYLKHWK